MHLTSSYAPTIDKDDQEKERSYGSLEKTCNRIPRHDLVIIRGDFKAKLGNKEYVQLVAGPHTFHDLSNENDNMLIQFAIRNRLIIKSAMFRHKNIYMCTWRTPGSNEVNQIDHVLSKSRHSSSVTDDTLQRIKL